MKVTVPFFTPPHDVIVLKNAFFQAWILPYGARLMQFWWMAAPEGPRPLCLGFKNPAHYRQDKASMGAVCGRYANRIGNGKLERDGMQWSLDINNAEGHCLHGGREGSGDLDWTASNISSRSVTLNLDTPDGHMGFPGRCHAEVTYALDGSRLHWQVQAQVDAPCPLNFVQHSYWNLDASADLKHHKLKVDAHAYLPTDTLGLPLATRAVDGTCFDFRSEAGLSAADILKIDAALQLDNVQTLRQVARFSTHDLAMTVSTDRPWLHVYASANLKASLPPLGATHQPGAALCLETEDMPNGPALGAPVWYGSGEPYLHQTVFEFS